MVHSCVVPSCRENSKISTNRTFHSFPKDDDRRKQWEVAIKRTNFTATVHSKVCSKHFTPDCFDTTHAKGTWLKPHALPTLFEPGEPPKKRPQKRRKARTPKKILTTRTESPVSTPTTKRESPGSSPTTQGDSPVSSPTTKGESPRKQGEYPAPLPYPLPYTLPTKIGKPNVESGNKALLELHKNPPTIKGESPDDSWNKALLKLHKKTLTDRGLSPDESLDEEEWHRKRLCYFGDYEVEDMKSPENAQKFFEIARKEVVKAKKLVRKLRHDNNILRKRNEKLKEKVVGSKKEPKKKTKEKASPQHTEPSGNGLFVDRLVNPRSKEEYPKELKALSLNLYSYSPTAYIHVRRNFQYRLPHPGSVSRWIRDIQNHKAGSDNCACEACKVEAAEDCSADTEVCDCDECQAEDCDDESCDTEEYNADECDAEEDCDTEDYNMDGEDCTAAAFIADVCYTEVCNTTQDCTSDRCYTEL